MEKKKKLKVDLNKFNEAEPVYVQGKSVKGIALSINIDDNFIVNSDDEDDEFILSSPPNKKTKH